MFSLAPRRHRRFPLAVAAYGIGMLAGMAHATAPRPAGTAWKRRIQAILREPQNRHAFWGIEVYSLTRRRMLYRHNAARMFIPASNTKLFVTSAALCLLGPDYRYHTTVRAVAPRGAEGAPSLPAVTGGQVPGNLVLIGRGDPTLSGRIYPYPNPALHLRRQPGDQALAKLAAQVAAHGIRQVDGNIIGDDSYFRYQPYPNDWAQDDLMWGYGAPISALTINDNQMQMKIRPGRRAGWPARITIHRWLGTYRIVNRLLTVPSGGREKIHLDRPVGSRRLEIWGTMPLGARPDQETIAIVDPALHAARLFRRALLRQGVRVLGHAQARHCRAFPARLGNALRPCTPPRPGVRLARLRSPPLWRDLQWTLKVSQNLHAELLLRLLGRRFGGDGSLQAGEKVRADFLDTKVGLRPSEYNFHDGSGLSRATLIQPRAIVKLLRYMARRPAPLASMFRSFLPLAGVDGSLEHRFLHTPLQGRLWAKTGYVEHDRALSGYLTSRSGERLVFSIIVNADANHGAQVRHAIDQIALAIYQQ